MAMTDSVGCLATMCTKLEACHRILAVAGSYVSS